MALAWTAPESYPLLGHLGLLALDPLASLKPVGQWARFGEGFYMQRCVGRVDHGYPGISVGHLLPTSCGQFSVAFAAAAIPTSLDSW